MKNNWLLATAALFAFLLLLLFNINGEAKGLIATTMGQFNIGVGEPEDIKNKESVKDNGNLGGKAASEPASNPEMAPAAPKLEPEIPQSDSGADGAGQKDRGMEVSRGPEQGITVDNVLDILVLVNKHHNLPAGYVPPDLVKPDIPFTFQEDLPKKQLRQEAALAAEQLFRQAEADGMTLLGVSGYRSYDTQKAIFTAKAKSRGFEEANKYSAYPGQSEHQTGLALDVSTPSVGNGLVTSFAETAESRWLQDNAARFGFIIRYPRGKTHITGYNYEPWHLRYVGTEAAAAIAAEGLTLEEFLGQD